MKGLLTILAATISLGALAQVDPDRVVATVNGEPIRGAEYYRRMEFLPGVGRVVGQGRIAEFPPGFMTLEQIITERLVMQLAKERGLTVTDGEVDAELRSRLEDDPKFLENWTATGQTEADLRAQLRLEVTQFKILTQGINITDQDVEQFYKANPDTFTIPRRVTLRIIAADTAAVRDAVDADLKAGKPFAEVATARSADPVTRASGGEYGTLPVSVLSEAVRNAIANVKVGATTGWVAAQDVQVKFLVENILPAELQPLTPQLRKQWRRQLALDRGRVRNDIQALMRDMRRRAQVEITEKGFAEAYRRFIDAYLRSGSPGTARPGG